MAKVVDGMIPVLFSSVETNFAHNGIGRLIDCLSCKVTEERNGIYECEFQYPVNGRLFQQLIQGGIIGVTHDDTGDVQPFDIYRHSAEIGGIVTFNARHISYRLNGITVSRFTASSCAAALAAIGTNSAQPNPFSFSTDKAIVKTYDSGGIKAARSVLMGETGSILQLFQGEYKFDKWTVSLLTSRGSDSGVTVRYGKNMTGITWERDETNCYNAVAPIWTDGTNTVSLPEVYVQPTTPISPVVCVPLDMSQMIEGQPTVARLRQAAIEYLDTKEPWKPYDKISVNFVAMWQSPEYASIAAIQRISLCDTVSIYWTDMGIVAEKAKVVRIVYDVLAERYDSMEVGSVSSEFVAITTDTQTGETTPHIPEASDATPQALGTASAGTSNDYSRADHVHPALKLYNKLYYETTDATGNIVLGSAFQNRVIVKVEIGGVLVVWNIGVGSTADAIMIHFTTYTGAILANTPLVFRVFWLDPTEFSNSEVT